MYNWQSPGESEVETFGAVRRQEIGSSEEEIKEGGTKGLRFTVLSFGSNSNPCLTLASRAWPLHQ